MLRVVIVDSTGLKTRSSKLVAKAHYTQSLSILLHICEREPRCVKPVSKKDPSIKAIWVPQRVYQEREKQAGKPAQRLVSDYLHYH